MQGRRRELEVGGGGWGGGQADKRKSERDHGPPPFTPPRLDGDVPRRVSAEKKKTERGREGRKEGEGGVGPCLVV